jgi:fido (protein-threonine AMPylation protein)
VTTPPPRLSRSPHLVDLIAESERLAALIAGSDATARAAVAAARGPGAALASLRLDGADLADVPSDDDIAAARAVVEPTEPDTRRYGTWFDAMRVHVDLDPDHERQLRALEYAGVVDALAADDLVDPLLTDPTAALSELHRRLTRGLVAPERAGAVREVEQAVHDAAAGRVLFFTADPATIERSLALLASWVTTAGAREHGLVTSGVVHHELLRVHPFDAANGRLARAAARLLLRARGLDPAGLAAPEPALAADPLGYHEEVARTVRRRDLTIWLERWGEAVTAGLRDAARDLTVLPTKAPDRAARFLEGRVPGEVFTVADHRAEAGLGPEDSRADLQALLDAGRVERVLGSRGLRFRVTAP